MVDTSAFVFSNPYLDSTSFYDLEKRGTADILAFEESLGLRFAWVLHVGDFGIWPDPTRIDGATRRHEGAGDFPTWWAVRLSSPAHDHAEWIDKLDEFLKLSGRDLLDHAGKVSAEGTAKRVAPRGGQGGRNS